MSNFKIDICTTKYFHCPFSTNLLSIRHTRTHSDSKYESTKKYIDWMTNKILVPSNHISYRIGWITGVLCTTPLGRTSIADKVNTVCCMRLSRCMDKGPSVRMDIYVVTMAAGICYTDFIIGNHQIPIKANELTDIGKLFIRSKFEWQTSAQTLK